MLFFFRKADVPDNSMLLINLSGQTNGLGVDGSFSVDDGPSMGWDTSQPLPLRSPHRYSVEVDVVGTQAAQFVLQAEITSNGAQVGTGFNQSITVQPNDLNTLDCSINMTP